MYRHDPVRVSDQPDTTNEQAKVGPVPPVLVDICCKEQWIRSAAAARDASVYATTKGILWVGVIDEALNGSVAIQVH